MKIKDILNELNQPFPEMVSVDVLNKYRNQSKSDRGEYYHSMMDKMYDDEFKQFEPVTLGYHIHDEKVALSDGHTRLDAAIEVGLSKISAVVKISQSDARINAKTPPKIPKNISGDWIKPSDIGL